MSGESNELSKEDLLRFIKKKTKQLKAREEEVAKLNARIAELEAASSSSTSPSLADGAAAREADTANEEIHHEATNDKSEGADGSADQDELNQDQGSTNANGDAPSLEVLRQELKETQGKKDEAMKKLREILPKFKALQTRFAKVKSEQTEATELNEKLEKDLSLAKQRVEELELNVQSLQEMVRSGLVDVEGAEKRVKDAHAETQQQLADRQTQLDDLQSRYDQDIADLQKELAKAQESSQFYRDQQSQGASETAEIVAQLQADLDAARADAAALREELEIQTSKASAELDEVCGKAQSLQQELEEAQSRIQQLESDAETAEQAVKSSGADLEATVQQLRDSLQQAESASQESQRISQSLQGDLIKAQQNNEEHETSLANLRTELEQAYAESKQHADTVNQLRADVEQAQGLSQSSQCEVEDLRQQLEEATSQGSDHEQALQKLREELQQAQSESEEHQRSLVSLRQDLEQTESKASQSEEAVHGLKKELEESYAVADDKQKSISRLQKDLEQAQSLSKEHEDTIDALRKDLEQVRAQVAGNDSEGVIEGLHKEIEDTRAAKEEAVSELRKELANTEEKLEERNEAVTELEGKLKRLQEAQEVGEQLANELRQKLSEAEDSKQTHISQIELLQSQLEQAETLKREEGDSIDELREKLISSQTLAEEHQATIEGMNEKFEEAAQNHEANILELRQQLEQVGASKQEHAVHIEELRQQLEQAEKRDQDRMEELRGLHMELEDAQALASEKAALVVDLQTALDQAQLSMPSSSEDNATKETDDDIKQEDIENIHTLRGQLEEAQAVIMDLRAQLEEAMTKTSLPAPGDATCEDIGSQSLPEQKQDQDHDRMEDQKPEVDTAGDTDLTHAEPAVVHSVTNPGNEADVTSLLQALALAESREELALETSLRANALLAAAEANAAAQREEASQERALLEKKVQEWKKRGAELGKRFKALKDRLNTSLQERDQAKTKHVGAVLQLIDRGSLTRRQQLTAFSHWRRFVAAQAQADSKIKLESAQSSASQTVEDERNARSKLEQECDRLKKEVEGHESFATKLKQMLTEARTELESLRETQQANQEAPFGFSPAKDALCVVRMKSTIYVAVRVRQGPSASANGVEEEHNNTNTATLAVNGSGEEEEEKSTSLVRWVDADTYSSWAKGKRYVLPDPVDEVVRKECEHQMHEYREQAAWAMAEKEHLETDLAKARRNAQLAVKAAKEGAKKVDAKAKATEAKLRAQLESELARVTRQVDKKQEEIENIQAEKENIDIALSAARRDLAAAEKSRNELEASISQRFEDMQQRLANGNEEALETARKEYEEGLAVLERKVSALQTELENTSTTQKQTEKSLQEVTTERKRLDSLYAAAKQEIEELKDSLQRAQAATKPPVTGRHSSSYWKMSRQSDQHQQRREPGLGEPEKTGVEADRAGETTAHLEEPDSGVGSTDERILSTNISSRNRRFSRSSFSSMDDEQPGGAYSRSRVESHNGHMDPLIAAAAAASSMHPSKSFDMSPLDEGMHGTAASVISQSQSLFVEQLDALHSQHARERIVWQREMDVLREHTEDVEGEHRLLTEQVAVLKEEIRDLRRALARTQTLSAAGEEASEAQRAQENLTYLKHVVFKYMVTADASERKTLLPVVSTILQFSPQEMDQIRSQIDSEGAGGAARSVVGMFFGGGNS